MALAYIDDAPGQLAAAGLRRIAEGEPLHDTELRGMLRRAWQAGDKERLFAEVFGPWIEAGTAEAWRVRQELEGLPFGDLGPERLAAWVAERPEPRARRLAEVVGAPAGSLSVVHVMLLERYGAQGVGSRFFGAYLSGVYWGPESQWLRRKLADAQPWLADERPAGEEWARDVIRSLEAMVERAEKREAEERFR